MRFTCIALILCVAGGCAFDPSGVRGDGEGDAAPGAPDAGLELVDGTPSPIDGAALTCAADPTPPGPGECPDACTGGCEEGVCRIECSGDRACDGLTLTCPAGYACDILCDGSKACEKARIDCPDTYACSLACTGAEACADADLHCTDGACRTSCGTGGGVCDATQVHCGPGECAATCAGGSAPVLGGCGSSCGCTSC